LSMYLVSFSIAIDDSEPWTIHLPCTRSRWMPMDEEDERRDLQNGVPTERGPDPPEPPSLQTRSLICTEVRADNKHAELGVPLDLEITLDIWIDERSCCWVAGT